MSSVAAGRAERHDALLRWASERGSGSWVEWKQCCATLELDPSQAASWHAQLGHLELDWANGRFSVAPGALVQVDGLDGFLLHTGTRPTGELERLRSLAEQGSFDVELAEPVAQLGGRGPSTILVEAAPADGELFAQAAGLRVEPDPSALAEHLPAFALEQLGELRQPDLRFAHCLVDPGTLVARWGASDDERTDGLWLVHSYRGRYEQWLRREGTWWHLPLREYGPYFLSHGRTDVVLLEYEPALRILKVRSRAPLPPLQARIVTLCSGRMPRVTPFGDEHQERYVNVPVSVARRIAESLGSWLHQEGES